MPVTRLTRSKPRKTSGRWTYKRKGLRRIRTRNVIPRSLRMASIMVRRTTYGGAWQFGTAATSGFWQYLAPNMTAFNNFNEFAAVFDEYRVNAIKITFRPRYDNVALDNSFNAAMNQSQAYAHYCVDPASTVVPSGTYTQANLNTFLEGSGIRTKTLNRPFSIYFRPKVLEQVSGGGTAGVVRDRRPWVRTTETGQIYRGVHMFLQQNNMATGNVNITLDTYYTFYVTFRNLK